MNRSCKTQSLYGLIFILLVFLCACSPSQIRYQQQRVSRDYTYLEFMENVQPLTLVAEVGGEHMSFYKVLAFQGDKFKVRISALDGKPFAGISGEGIHTQESLDGSSWLCVVEVKALETLFTIDLSAHPFSRYQLRIEKL